MMTDDRPANSGGTEPVEAESSLFRWETLRLLREYPLQYRVVVPGSCLQVELVKGPIIHVWRAEDCRQYFCHGLTFGGKDAPGGPVSPFSGEDVDAILTTHYRVVHPESAARPGDILVWRDWDGTPFHSAILYESRLDSANSRLSYASMVQTKNGIEPEAVMSLGQLIEDYYGESYQVYRLKGPEGEPHA
jgi:hypothetical protein